MWLSTKQQAAISEVALKLGHMDHIQLYVVLQQNRITSIDRKPIKHATAKAYKAGSLSCKASFLRSNHYIEKPNFSIKTELFPTHVIVEY